MIADQCRLIKLIFVAWIIYFEVQTVFAEQATASFEIPSILRNCPRLVKFLIVAVTCFHALKNITVQAHLSRLWRHPLDAGHRFPRICGGNFRLLIGLVCLNRFLLKFQFRHHQHRWQLKFCFDHVSGRVDFLRWDFSLLDSLACILLFDFLGSF